MKCWSGYTKMKESVNIGNFTIGFRVFRDEDGSLSYFHKEIFETVPTEAIIMQLETYVKHLKDQYYNKYRRIS